MSGLVLIVAGLVALLVAMIAPVPIFFVRCNGKPDGEEFWYRIYFRLMALFGLGAVLLAIGVRTIAQ